MLQITNQKLVNLLYNAVCTFDHLGFVNKTYLITPVQNV